MLSPYKPSKIQRIAEVKIKIKGTRKINKDKNDIKKITRKCKKIQYYF